jgi:hypothetical protein
MPYSAILIGHICAGTLGLLSGTAAMFFRKGSPRHVLAGRVFVASMLTMAVGAVYLAIVRHQPGNIGGGIITFYLVGTAWHLWRMCFGLFIAAGSFLLGPSNRPLRLLSGVGLGQHLPQALFSTTLYLILTILPLIMLIFWLVRVRFTNAYKGSVQLASASPDLTR